MPRDNNQGRTAKDNSRQNMNEGSKKNVSQNNMDQLEKESEKLRTKKPGSQSNSSKRHNNGRGGGK